MKIALIGTDWNTNDDRKNNNRYGGVTYYRLIKPLLELNDDRFEFVYHGADLLKEAEGKNQVTFWTGFVSRYDGFIIKHIDNEQACSNLIFFAKKQGKKIVLDLDDNLFEVKPDQPGYVSYAPGKPKRAVVAALISFVDALFVSTQPLADYYKYIVKKMFNKELRVYVLPNYNDVQDFNFEPAEKNPERITIGWTGSTTHFNDLKIVLPAIEKLMQEYPNLYFELVGGLTHADAPRLFYDFDEKLLDRVFCGSGTESWEGYPKLLSTYKWDIGIAPLTNDEFNRGKSHIKWMEYSMYKIPIVASKVFPYFRRILGQDTIVDGKTGFLCTEKQWYSTLKMLIDDPSLRKEIGQNSYEYVRKNLQYKDHHYLWKEALSLFTE